MHEHAGAKSSSSRDLKVENSLLRLSDKLVEAPVKGLVTVRVSVVVKVCVARVTVWVRVLMVVVVVSVSVIVVATIVELVTSVVDSTTEVDAEAAQEASSSLFKQKSWAGWYCDSGKKSLNGVATQSRYHSFHAASDVTSNGKNNAMNAQT